MDSPKQYIASAVVRLSEKASLTDMVNTFDAPLSSQLKVFEETDASRLK